MAATNHESFDDQRFEELLKYGIQAVKAGQNEQAKSWLEKALRMRYSDSRAWLWLSATTDDVNEQRKFLERAVAADPGNSAARRGLVLLSDKLDKQRLMPEGTEVPQPSPDSIQESQAKDFQCPQCSGVLHFDVVKFELVCKYCGYVKPTQQQLAADNAEQVMDFVLPTTRAHRWAQSRQRLGCERCGSVILVDPGSRANRCSYCGSNRLVDSPEQAELLEPQLIALMKIDKHQVKKQLRAWLGKGLFTPDDLVLKTGGLVLRPAYYPFWTFDGTLELPWSCELNEGSNKSPRWVPRSGKLTRFFDDVLIPGLHSIKLADIEAVEPFNLKGLISFNPDYLAGWTAFGYDLPMSDASLLAREKIIQSLRPSLSSEIHPGKEKRGLRTGSGNWSGLTYKHVLLPLWIGNYLYQGERFQIRINGQTGKVAGKKPVDKVKILLVITIMAILLLGLPLVLHLTGVF